MATASSNSSAPVLLRPRNFQWHKNSAPYPLSDEEQWQKYTEVENEIIEDAFNTSKSEIEIDGNYIIDLVHLLQYKKLDRSDAHQIKRFQLTEARSTREERFSSPVTLASASKARPEPRDSQVQACLKCNDFPSAYYYQELEGKTKQISDVVQASADGILKEGTTLGKPCEAKWLADQLLGVKRYGESNEASHSPTIPSVIGETCVNLYTKQSFWCQLLNEKLRDLEAVTPEQVKTLGPFSWLLQHYSQKRFSLKAAPTVYRGLTLTDDQRKKFMEKEMTVTAFTSTSENRNVAEMFSGNNTLLIIDLNVIEYATRARVRCGNNISRLSNFPQEEEYLIWPTTIFDFVKHEHEENKHIIYLKVAAKNC